MSEAAGNGVDRAHAPGSERLGEALTRAAGGSRPLLPEEIAAVLRRNWWGVLSTVREGQPYAVPVAYGMSGGAFHIASREGRKLENLRDNPNVCLTVAEVASGSSWCSVVVIGRTEWVEGGAAIAKTLAALRRQCGVSPRAALSEARRLIGAHFFRIVAVEVTGRIREEA